MMMIKNNIDKKNSNLLAVFLMGPTATEKTSVAIALKKRKLKIDIISVDSALVYRGMDIGTGKPVTAELELAPHKLIDIRDPVEYYSVADFYHDANKEIDRIRAVGHIPFLVGGTMLYFKILLQGLFCLPSTNQKIRNALMQEAQQTGWLGIYNTLQRIDPIAASAIHINDHKRIIRALEIFFSSGKTSTELKLHSVRNLRDRIYQFVIFPSNRDILNKKIEKRFYKMLEIGFENEVSKLFARSDLHGEMKPSISGVGYRQMWEYLSGDINYHQMISKGICATRQLAKRQLTWLRNWPNLHYLDGDHLQNAIDDISKILKRI